MWPSASQLEDLPQLSLEFVPSRTAAQIRNKTFDTVSGRRIKGNFVRRLKDSPGPEGCRPGPGPGSALCGGPWAQSVSRSVPHDLCVVWPVLLLWDTKSGIFLETCSAEWFLASIWRVWLWSFQTGWEMETAALLGGNENGEMGNWVTQETPQPGAEPPGDMWSGASHLWKGHWGAEKRMWLVGLQGWRQGRRGNCRFPLSKRRKSNRWALLFPEGVSFSVVEWGKPRPADFSDGVVWRGERRAGLHAPLGPWPWAVLGCCVCFLPPDLIRSFDRGVRGPG